MKKNKLTIKTAEILRLRIFQYILKHDHGKCEQNHNKMHNIHSTVDLALTGVDWGLCHVSPDVTRHNWTTEQLSAWPTDLVNRRNNSGETPREVRGGPELGRIAP